MSTAHPWFTNLAQEYARRFADLEFARQKFESERDLLLNHLTNRASAVDRTGAWTKESPSRRTLYVKSAKWSEFQKGRGKNNMYAGCALTLGDAPSFSESGECVFVAQAFFGAASDVTSLVKGVNVEGCEATASNFGYARFARIVAPYGTQQFSPERFDQAADDLLPFFYRAEAALIDAVKAGR